MNTFIPTFMLLFSISASSCSITSPPPTITRTLRIDQKESLILFADSSFDHISHLTFVLTGRIDGESIISLSEPDTLFILDTLESGEVNWKYDSDWYSSTCYFTYNPKLVSEGRLSITAQFFGTTRSY